MTDPTTNLVERLDEAVNDSEATAMNAVYVNVLLRDVLAYLQHEAASRRGEVQVSKSRSEHMKAYRDRKRADGYCEEGGCWKRADVGRQRCAQHLAAMRKRVYRHRREIANG